LELNISNPNVSDSDTLYYFVEFVVLYNGEIIVNRQYPNISNSFDSLVLNTICRTEPWIPSKLNGQDVNTSITLPFAFPPKKMSKMN
jgi:hypothetical protein